MNTVLARYRFHAVAVAALAATVFAGFAKTYYFKIFLDSAPLATAAHLHGIIATLWVALHYTQARLVAAHRVNLHRRLGIFAAFVAALLAVHFGGGIALVVSIPLRRWIGFTDAWLPIARWLVG